MAGRVGVEKVPPQCIVAAEDPTFTCMSSQHLIAIAAYQYLILNSTAAAARNCNVGSCRCTGQPGAGCWHANRAHLGMPSLPATNTWGSSSSPCTSISRSTPEGDSRVQVNAGRIQLASKCISVERTPWHLCAQTPISLLSYTCYRRCRMQNTFSFFVNSAGIHAAATWRQATGTL